MRIFLAFDIPEHIKDIIVELEERIARKSKHIRLTSRSNMHITIKFLGEQPIQSVNRIVDILNNSSFGIKKIRISLNKIGVFKSIENPSVLWVGEFNPIFESFSRSISKELDMFRKTDVNQFCHVTIGRMKRIPKDEIIGVLRLASDFLKSNELSFDLKEFYLYESRLYRKGAVYLKLENFKLKESKNG